MILNAIDKQRRVIYNVVQSDTWTETNGKSITVNGGTSERGDAGVTLKGNLEKAGCQSNTPSTILLATSWGVNWERCNAKGQPPWKRFPHSRRLHGCRTALPISFQAVGETNGKLQELQFARMLQTLSSLNEFIESNWNHSPPCMRLFPRMFWQLN